ncbi:hypothetical protein VZT92_014956 [Zoarces viviparus]|uniref:Secreted protein n=1 Tax=Zoarces viviparus TaxID=48416 RepID=A0AAW1EVH9_ZOAVI
MHSAAAALSPSPPVLSLCASLSAGEWCQRVLQRLDTRGRAHGGSSPARADWKASPPRASSWPRFLDGDYVSTGGKPCLLLLA